LVRRDAGRLVKKSRKTSKARNKGKARAEIENHMRRGIGRSGEDEKCREWATGRNQSRERMDQVIQKYHT